jgi:predicted transport protein
VASTFLEYLEHNPAALELLEHLRHAVKSLGPTQEMVTKSQVAFKAEKAFAWAWAPEQYLGRGAPLVLTVNLPFRDESSRWKEIVEPSPGRFTHHLELKSTADIDDQVHRWLQIARQQAG